MTLAELLSRRDSPGIDFLDAVAITVHDTDLMSVPCRALWVGAAGAVKVTTAAGTDITLTGVPAGTLLRIAVKRVWATGTTVTTPNTNIVGLV